MASQSRLVLTGRSSSHFTRVARIFASELKLSYEFCVLQNLSSQQVAEYGYNPALKIPVLRTGEDTWFGTLNICRELLRQSAYPGQVLWPEDLQIPLLANAQELVLHAMATEVALILAQGEGGPATGRSKNEVSLKNTLQWLDRHAAEINSKLPERELSFLEATLFCLIDHLEFRRVLALEPYRRLLDFRDAFADRACARATPYLFDPIQSS